MVAKFVTLASVSVAFLAVLRTASFLLQRRRAARTHLSRTGLTDRIEAMRRDLDSALERAETERRRNETLVELVSTLDIEKVLTRTLRAAADLIGVDGALIDITGLEGEVIVAALGLRAEEVDDVLRQTPQGRQIRLVDVERADTGQPITADLVRRLRGEAGDLGVLKVFSRAIRPTLGEKTRQDLKMLALVSGPMIENVCNFHRVRQLAEFDAVTGLHNRRYFDEALAREVSRAQRHGRELALVVFDLDDFKAINNQFGHLAGDAALAGIGERVREVIRTADIACRIGGDEFAVVLTESGVRGAHELYKRFQEAISSSPTAEAGRPRVSAGVAELQPGEDGTSLFQRADAALYKAKRTGKDQAVAA